MSKNAPQNEKFHCKIELVTANDQWILISFALLYLIVLATEIIPELKKIETTAGLLPSLIIIFLLPLIYLLTRPGIRGKRSLPPITLDEDSMRCPVKIGSRKYIRIPYTDITALDSRGSGNGAFHVLRAKDRCLQFPIGCFKNRSDWQTLINCIIDRINLSPAGQNQLNLFLQQNRLAHSIFNQKPIFTLSLLGMLTAVFALQSLSKSLDVHNLAGWGANSAELVASGEFFRLLSASFLHAGVLHFCINFISLLSLGYIVEGCLGARRTLLIYFFAVIAGSFLSAFAGASLSVGASAGIFGLLAAFAVINLRFHQYLPAGVSMPLRWWIIVTTVNLVLPVLFPMIDQAAHTGGLLAGGLLTWLMLRGAELGYNPQIIKKWESLHLITLFIFIFLAIVNAWPYVSSAEQRKTTNLNATKYLIENRQTSAVALNTLAQNIIREKTPQKEFFLLAENALGKLLKKDSNARFQMTLAQLQIKQNKIPQALATLTIILQTSELHTGVQDLALHEISEILQKQPLNSEIIEIDEVKNGNLNFLTPLTKSHLVFLLYTENDQASALGLFFNKKAGQQIQSKVSPCAQLLKTAKLSNLYLIDRRLLRIKNNSTSEQCYLLSKP